MGFDQERLVVVEVVCPSCSQYLLGVSNCAPLQEKAQAPLHVCLAWSTIARSCSGARPWRRLYVSDASKSWMGIFVRQASTPKGCSFQQPSVIHVGAELDVTARRGGVDLWLGAAWCPRVRTCKLKHKRCPATSALHWRRLCVGDARKWVALRTASRPETGPPARRPKPRDWPPQHVRFEHAERRVDLCSGGARCPRARTCRSKHKCCRASGALPWRRVRGEAIRMWDCAQPAAPRLAPPQHADRSLNVGVSPPGERVKGRVDFWSGGA